MNYKLPAALLACALTLSGCFGVLVAAGGETAAVVAQERSVGAAVDDATILLRIKHLFAEATEDLFLNVEVKSVEGRVLLTGNVDKPETKVEAVRLVWTVGGVKEVIDEMQINDQSGFLNYTRDVWISTQIRARLIATKNIRSINFSIITVNQVVYVMGIAQNQEELNIVNNIASTTSYVQRVVSYAQLKSDPRRKQ